MTHINWRPQIGDPTFAGWFTVFSYFLAAVLAYHVYGHFLNSKQLSHDKQRLFWLSIVLCAFFMGINKQLDLQSLLTAIGKYFAYQQGWYQNRRTVQGAFIAIVFLFGTSIICWGLGTFKGILKDNWLAFTGIVFLIVFILIRASSFHHMDSLIRTHFLGLKLNWLLELSGIYCIIINAVRILTVKKISSQIL
jgi:hypothetical protein